MNNIATTQTSMDYYQEQPKNNNTILNPYKPSTTNVHEVNPKGNIVKQVGRIKRTRSSRKSPTTLLNANVNNFRTLVQHYTGCERANSSFLKMRKGPINLNFAGGNEDKDHVIRTISVGSNSTSSEGFGYNNNRSNNNNNDSYYHQETSQVMPEDHHTIGSRRNNLVNSDVRDSSPDMLSVDDYFMENTSFSW